MRLFKAAMTVIGSIAIVVWFGAMVHIGMAKSDEWYGHMDKQTIQKGPLGEVPNEGPSEPPMAECIDDSAPNAPCEWDATIHGNGEGKSFTIDESGNVTYWEDYRS